jgi:hypothetical protein
MTVVVTPPTVPMMRVSNIDDYLRARCWNQRHQEREGENSKRNLLHTHGMSTSPYQQRFNSATRSPFQESNPIQVALNWARCNMAFSMPNA